ncbi:maleylpyruvate isomerase family mycothiol-dependent enzyme [Mycobacterium sp. CPCC 205372]|uniref:Maleylpyruvate isomerase family mycothiol-dependent enzyme n=1 Tax=Mycobacterium hippophais TaxID=3016340 RepID=A0ABT4PTU6_9MYCO|nr:maleylpyruvate isomerase family mycothiol-dependent enzyme [Mycobacterium hippophais]MCZ8379992.1 maleylpyruvate isomerase family mycothiol-dependent enzyme [Mycobacterium hippophais]
MRLSRGEREQVLAAVADERRSIAELLHGLDAEQLATPSLCAGWDVKTVAAHLVSDFKDGFRGFLISGVRHGSIDRGIDALARRRARASAVDIAQTLEREADHPLSPPVAGPMSGLADVLVHGGDMRIPLGIEHQPDPLLVARAIDFLTGPTQIGFFPRRRLRGIALHDEDTGRTWGEGAAVRGPGVAVMMAICGRTVAFDNVTGAGVSTLRSRLA